MTTHGSPGIRRTIVKVTSKMPITTG